MLKYPSPPPLKKPNNNNTDNNYRMPAAEAYILATIWV